MGPVRETFIVQAMAGKGSRVSLRARAASFRNLAIISVRSLASLRAAPWLIAVLILPVYLAFPTRNYNWDGVDFALTIENAAGFEPSLIHPHHLIYNTFGLGVHRLLQGLGHNLRAIQSLQIANSILGALSAGLLFALLRNALRSTYLSYVLTALFAFSATWWRYSTDASPYVATVFLLLACANLAVTARSPWPITLAFLHSAAMCFHQLAVLFYPVIGLAILLHPSGLDRQRRIRAAVTYTVTACSLTLAAYYYGFYIQTGAHSASAFPGWITSYLHGAHSYKFGFDLWSNVVYTLRGHLRLFFGGRISWIEGLVNFSIGALIASLSVIVAVLLLNLFRCTREFSGQSESQLPDKRYRNLVLICAVWIVVYLGFIFFWYPHFTPYRLFYLPAIVLLLGTVLARHQIVGDPARRWSATMFIAGLAISNFLFLIFPLSHVDRNPPLAFTLRSTRDWPVGSVVYYREFTSDNRLLRYFSPPTAWKKVASTDEMSEKEIENVYRGGSSVWMETSAYEHISSAAGNAQWLFDHTRETCRHELINDKHRIRLVQLFPRRYSDGESAGCMELVHK